MQKEGEGQREREGKEGRRKREKYVTDLANSSELMNPGKENIDVHCAFL